MFGFSPGTDRTARNRKYSALLFGYQFMSTKKSASGPRELIDTGRNKVYARRDAAGRFSEMTDQGRSLSSDSRHHTTHKKPARQGDKGD
jgi:hypothetical protein